MIILNDRWRVQLAPYPPPQWLLEQRTSKTGWKTRSWCQTRHGLLMAINEKVVHASRFYPQSRAESMPVDQTALDAIRAWPSHVVAFIEQQGGHIVPENDDAS
jgi:hypothetical protein